MPPPGRPARREGGIFQLRITFADSYPDKPPRVRFMSPIFHPTVYPDGTVCMDLLQEAWSPCNNVCSILTSLQASCRTGVA